MIIPYSSKGQQKEIILGAFFGSMGAVYASNDPESIFPYVLALSGILYLASVLYKKRNPYLKIENGLLKKSDVIPKQIRLSEVVRIKEFAGDYTLFTPEKKLKIHSYWISQSSKKEFKNFLDSLNLQIEHTTRKVSSFDQH